MRVAGPRVLGRDGIREAAVLFGADGRVQAVEDTPGHDPDVEGLVVPAPVNAHTHLADHAARGQAEGLPLEEAVAPPDGLKHRFLRSTDRPALRESFQAGLSEVAASGAHRAIDFREQGPEGARIARAAAERSPVDVTVLGRPTRPGTWETEAPDLVELVDGIGISGLADQPYEVSQAQADWCAENGKRLGLHLSEGDHEDVDAALALEPDLLVHGTHLDRSDVDRVAEAGVPLVLCPRSNASFGHRPPVESLVEAGVRLGLGTDNAMFHEADVWAEAAWLVDRTEIPAVAVLRIACGFHLPGEPAPTVEPGRPVAILDDTDGLERAITERRITVPWRDTLAGTRP